MKINKNIKIFFNYFLGPLLFAWLCWSIYNQVRLQEGLAESWVQIKDSLSSVKIIYLAAVLILMAVNWMTEAYKWRLAVKSVQQMSFLRALKAVLSGVSFSVSTPNSIGDYVGRVLYINEGKRIKAATLTVVSNTSQLLVTILMGLCSLYFLKEPLVAARIISLLWFDALFYIVALSAVVLLIFYFRISWMVKWINRLPSGQKFSWSIEALEQFNATLLLRLLSLSVTRFFIFILQYFLLFQLFEVDLSFWQVWTGISVLFLILAIIPTIALFTDLSVRGSLSLTILGLFNANQLGISLTSASIWLINLIIPALIGSVLVLGIKRIFKSKNENA
ncbi:lysylphosphatidylglycerol synthase domain-containing protein [Niabella drilacis]|uniref:Lysylphosphatidylglycerol synthase TM region n=1 Tax=Niabella drilacis (strain DSM 25811 / CCM 8410 / CCUG 62505 / LMG 26954 / E90) TaxID=1285928 RepID=A0A1G6YNW6_NIADE|nr:lysylphosphatidylglycerol synthase domain-containing protein [Niabella drilacis]SDD92214.1 Lysylphosphatidylglycerol synthase TM region [Niabella drilacis]